MNERFTPPRKVFKGPPPLPRSAWSVESIKLDHTDPASPETSKETSCLNLDKRISRPDYQSLWSRTSASPQPTPQRYTQDPQGSRQSRPRHRRQHSSIQYKMQDNYSKHISTCERRRVRPSLEVLFKRHNPNSERSRSKNKASKTTDMKEKPQSHKRSSRGSQSNRSKSNRKHTGQQLPATSCTVIEWLLRKLTCGG